MDEPLLLTTARVTTSAGGGVLTNATGFFFERDRRLFLVTSRHVLVDEPSGHRPDRIEIELHTDQNNLARSTGFGIPLYVDGRPAWQQATDTAGEIDVAVVEVERAALPLGAVYAAFTPRHVHEALETVRIGTPMLIVGYPLGFHDTLHHLPVARQAINASPLELRFQGEGYFLTEARTHRGTSGAPVVIRADDEVGELSWKLLGIHSARLDVGTRDLDVDEALGLNCAWFADVLMPLTER